jgi:hypothetical protein
MSATLCLLIYLFIFLLNMSVIDMLVVLNMFQFFCKKTMTRIDVVLFFRYLTYHGSGMCLAAFVLLNLFCGL